MSVDQELLAGAERPVAQSGPERARSRLARFGAALVRQTVVEPISNGRLRDLDWPYGLRSIVVIGYVAFGVAAATVIVSGFIRRHSSLIVSATGLGLPEQLVWPLVLLLSFGVACCVSAALHGPWWLKLLGLLFALMVIGTWSLRRGALAGWAGWPLIAAALMAGVVVLVIIRWRRRFAWVGVCRLLGADRSRNYRWRGRDPIREVVRHGFQPAQPATDRGFPRLSRLARRHAGWRLGRRNYRPSNRLCDRERATADPASVAICDLGGRRRRPVGTSRVADRPP
jgi:hypothetical protein